MEQNVIKVQFLKPIDNRTEYFFGSIEAIYQRFSAAQIGCTKQSLWAHKLSINKPKATDKCIISKYTITRKSKNKDCE